MRIILDLWAAPPQCGYWGSMGSFCSAPQDFGLLGFFCARFPPREARYINVQCIIVLSGATSAPHSAPHSGVTSQTPRLVHSLHYCSLVVLKVAIMYTA